MIYMLKHIENLDFNDARTSEMAHNEMTVGTSWYWYWEFKKIIIIKGNNVVFICHQDKVLPGK